MESKRKIYISIIFFGAISLLLIILVLIPLVRNIRKYSADLVSQKKDLAMLQKEIETFNETKSLYEDAKENINKIDKLFYDPDNPLDFLNFLTKKPADYNVKNEILKMLTDAYNQSSPWPSVSFQISSTGSFSSLMKFLKNLEAGPYLIEISNINIRRLTVSDLQGEKLKVFSLGDVSAALSIKVYSK